jgi:hypothetical protein
MFLTMVELYIESRISVLFVELYGQLFGILVRMDSFCLRGYCLRDSLFHGSWILFSIDWVLFRVLQTRRYDT